MTKGNTKNSLVTRQQTDPLNWDYFVLKIAELEAKKRDSIPVEVIHSWFNDFTARGWTKTIFDKQFQIVLDNRSFGAVKIDEFFQNIKPYTQEEINLMIEQKINSIIHQGELLLAGKEIEIELDICIDAKLLKLIIAKKIETYYRSEQSYLTDEIIGSALKKVIEEMNLEQKCGTYKREGIGTRLRKKISWR